MPQPPQNQLQTALALGAQHFQGSGLAAAELSLWKALHLKILPVKIMTVLKLATHRQIRRPLTFPQMLRAARRRMTLYGNRPRHLLGRE
jgi:hypothetical protein